MTLSAVLLAGGNSRRMGQDKATLLFRGTPLWRIQLAILRELQPSEILISAQNNPSWRPTDVDFVSDKHSPRGPLSGIAAAISRITTTHLLALGIDMPFMTVAYLRDLCGRCKFACGAVPVIGNRAEPLAAVYPREAEDDFVQALAGRDFSLQPLVGKLIAAAKLRPVEVAPEQRSLFRNLNKPQDVEGC